MAARWLFLRCRVDPWADVRYFSGLVLNHFVGWWHDPNF
jgi:hypothetical protein